MAAEPKRRLIINADDFGLLPEVNRAVIDCFQAGSLTSATLMVNAAGTAEAVALAANYPTLAVGLHFCLTHGRPILPHRVPSLVDPKGNFWGRREFERRVLSGRIQKLDVRREIDAQIQAFEATGLPLSHIDSHHHVHAFPLVFAEVARTAKELGVALRVPRVTFRHVRSIRSRQSLMTLGKKIILASLVAVSTARAGNGISAEAHLVSIYDITPLPRRIYAAHYFDLLKQAGPGMTELMVHPAFHTPLLAQLVGDGHLKDQERRSLCNFSLLAAAGRLGLESATYRDLAPRYAARSIHAARSHDYIPQRNEIS